MVFFLISSMVLGPLDRVFLTGLGLLELWHLIYPRLLTGFGMLVFFTNLSRMEFQARYLALFFLFSVIDNFEWFWFWVKSSQEYPVNAIVPQGCIFGVTLFLL